MKSRRSEVIMTIHPQSTGVNRSMRFGGKALRGRACAKVEEPRSLKVGVHLQPLIVEGTRIDRSFYLEVEHSRSKGRRESRLEVI
jgi:hypothetical protein